MCLLDIKVKEPTLESIMKKKKEYMPPMFMTVNTAATQLLQILNNLSNGKRGKKNFLLNIYHSKSSKLIFF